MLTYFRLMITFKSGKMIAKVILIDWLIILLSISIVVRINGSSFSLITQKHGSFLKIYLISK